MAARIDRDGPPQSRMLKVSSWLLGVAVCAGCGSSSADSTPPQCTNPEGSYVLTVFPTGQSELLELDASSSSREGSCPSNDAAQTVEVSFSDGAVSLNGENCQLCSTSSCQMDVLCGQSVTCPGSVVPFANPTTTSVQTASFALPLDADASTPNATVELGPSYCGYVGSASVAAP